MSGDTFQISAKGIIFFFRDSLSDNLKAWRIIFITILKIHDDQKYSFPYLCIGTI